MTEPHASGLDGIIVAETALSDVDGERGRLTIRGYAVEELVERATFEDVCGLMWGGRWPSSDERVAIAALLADARASAFAMLPEIGTALDSPDSMEALRTAVGHVRTRDPVADRVRLTGAIAVFAAAWARLQEDLPPVAPRAGLSHAADILQMLSGGTPDPARTRGLDAYLCCVVDHGMNASTFTARVVASTGSDRQRRRRRDRRTQRTAPRWRAGTRTRYAGRHRSSRTRARLARTGTDCRSPHHGHGASHLPSPRSTRRGARKRHVEAGAHRNRRRPTGDCTRGRTRSRTTSRRTTSGARTARQR